MEPSVDQCGLQARRVLEANPGRCHRESPAACWSTNFIQSSGVLVPKLKQEGVWGGTGDHIGATETDSRTNGPLHTETAKPRTAPGREGRSDGEVSSWGTHGDGRVRRPRPPRLAALCPRSRRHAERAWPPLRPERARLPRYLVLPHPPPPPAQAPLPGTRVVP